MRLPARICDTARSAERSFKPISNRFETIVVISLGCVPTRRPHVSGQDVLPLRRDTSQDCQITWLQRASLSSLECCRHENANVEFMPGKNLDQDQTLY